MLSHTLKLIWRMSPFCDSMCVYPLYLASSRLKRLSILRDPCPAAVEPNPKSYASQPLSSFAGIMGAKQTSQLIPLCHPIALTKVKVWLELDQTAPSVQIHGEAHTVGQTGGLL